MIRIFLSNLKFNYFHIKHRVTGWFKNNHIGKNCRIEGSVKLSNTKVGHCTYIGDYSLIDRAVIGNYCSIASFISIGGMDHDYRNFSTSTLLYKQSKKKLTIIEDDVWIGTKVTVRAGVKIGRGAVIGSNSVVLKDVDSYSIVVGVPAKHIKYRFDDAVISKLLKTNAFDYQVKETMEVLNNFK